MTQTTPFAGIILAAGKGTRMKSDLPKVLHRVCGLPMAEHVGRSLVGAGISRPVMVIGHGGELLQEALGESYDYIWQHEQLGTGHAVMQAAETLRDHVGPVLVVPGDTPLLTTEILRDLLGCHAAGGAACTMATAVLADPAGYGRIVRSATGGVERIVEHKDARGTELEISEVNAGVYVFDGPALFQILPQLSNANVQGEYYLTDVIKVLREQGREVTAMTFDDPGLLVGVNDRWQLAEADKLMRQRLLRRMALDGVTLLDPDTIYVDADVRVGRDTVIEPGTHLRGKTTIGEGCWIGPYTHILDCTIGEGCNVLMSHLKAAKLANRIKIGPFANIRPGAELSDEVKVGNFVEIKNALLGEDVAVSHLTYLGDATVGAGTNIGAGTITCNYDGFQKHRTEIGSDAFIGSNSTLVAPLKIGDGAMVAAGSVLTHNVPADALALGRARQENKEEWVSHWRSKKQSP